MAGSSDTTGDDAKVEHGSFEEAAPVSDTMTVEEAARRSGVTASTSDALYSEEAYAACEADDIQLTQQGSSGAGTHYFYLEPSGEGTYQEAELKKYHRNSSDTIARLEHLTIVDILDEGIGNGCMWCKVQVTDQERSYDHNGLIGYVRRSKLKRLQTDEFSWDGESTNPSPKITCHGKTKDLKALVPNWIRLSACEPFLNKKTLKYCTTVKTGHKNLNQREMLDEQAIKIGIKQLLVYYDKCPPGYDVRTLDDAVEYLQNRLYEFATVENIYVSSRPEERIKALVCVNMSKMAALPAMVRTFTTTTQIHTGHRTAIYQSNTIEKKFKLIADTMDRLQSYVDLFPGTIKGPQRFSSTKQGDRLRNYVPVLKKLMRANGYQLRKDHEDLIEIGTDAEFNPTHVIVYIEGAGKPQTVGFNAYASQMPASSERIMHYVLQGNNMYSEARTTEMQSLAPPWMKYLTKYTYPPLEIRPTPPSGLTLGNMTSPPNMAGLKAVQDQFNKLPLKGPREMSLERLKLSDPKFLTSMADARIDVALSSGDNLVTNLPVVLDKINSLDDVFGELLQKISIPKLIEQAMAKLMAELGLDNIYAAMLASVLGQFSAEALLEQFMFQLPDDLLADLIDQLLEMVDISCDDIIQILVKSGLQTDALQGIVDQIGDTMEGLQDSIDAAMGALPAPCGTAVEGGVDTDLEESLQETVDSIEDVLANLECDDLKGILKNVVTGGMPSVTIEKPTIDLSCFVVDFELLIAKILMPAIPLLAGGATLDIHRLNEIDWTGLKSDADEMDIKIKLPDGSFKRFGTTDGFDSPSSLNDLNIGLNMTAGGFDIANVGTRFNRPEMALAGSDGIPKIAFPNINLQDAFSEVGVGSLADFTSAISGMASGTIPGLQLGDLPGELEDLSFGDVLKTWRIVIAEAINGMMLSKFMFSMAKGGSAFIKLAEYMDRMTADAPERTPLNSSMLNVPEYNPTSLTVGCETTATAGVGWQSIVEMSDSWIEDLNLPTVSDLEAIQDAVEGEATEIKNAVDAYMTVINSIRTSTGRVDASALGCSLIDGLASANLPGIDIDSSGMVGVDPDLYSIDQILLPTFAFQPETILSAGCGPYKIMGVPDFGLSTLSLELPITGPNGDETFDILDMNNLLGKLPEVPNFPELVGAAGGDIELSCETPALFLALIDILIGNIPSVDVAMGRLNAELGRIPDLDASSSGEIPAVSAKKMGTLAFGIAIDRLGLGTFSGHMADILKGKLSAGELDINILLEIPIIKEKFDILIAGMPSMPTMQLPSLPGVDLEVPSLNLPGGGAIGSGFKIPTITLPDNIPTGDLMGGLFSGMQNSVKGAIESALVEMGKEVLRSLIQGAADSLGDASFGDANIADMLSDSLGSFDAALAVLEGAFANAGMDSDGTLTTTTTVTIEMGCGEEIDPTDPENEICTPYDFVTSISQRMTTGEVVELLEGRVSPNMCATIQETIIDGCPVYAAIFDDCGKISETFEAIGEYVQPDILDKKRIPVQPAVQDLQKLCCDAEIDLSRYAQLLRNKGLEDDQIDQQMEDVVQRKQDALEDLAKLLTGLQNDNLLDGIIPPIYSEDDCGECAEEEESSKGSLMPPDSEIPTLDFMNNMVVDLMYEPTRLMFKMEIEQYPEILESGSVGEEVVPWWDSTYNCASHYAELLYNQGGALCDSTGDLDAVDKEDWKMVREGKFDDLEGAGLFVKKQNNSGSVVPLLRESLRSYDYTSYVFDVDSQQYAWTLQYKGDAPHYLGEWPAITWKLQPPTEEELLDTASTSEIEIPSSDRTELGEIMGVSCGEPSVVESTQDLNDLAPEREVAAPGAIVPRLSFVAGEPKGYQIFKQFVKNKILDFPNFDVAEGVSELDEYENLLDPNHWGHLDFADIYSSIMEQLFQSVGVQTAFTKLFEMRDLRLLELEPDPEAPNNSCGEKPISLLDIENTAKNTTKDSLAKACMSPVLEQATGKNATKQAGLDGCILITIRAYVIDVALRSIFPLSEFELIDFKDGFYDSVVTAITTDMEAMDPTYYTDFMDTMPSVLSKLCSAAKCEGEPWLDPDTGEEMDCDSFGGTEGLKFLVKRQMQEITPILKEKFGTNPPSLSMRLVKDWLQDVPIAKQKFDIVFDNYDTSSGFMNLESLYEETYTRVRPEADDHPYTTGYLFYTATDGTVYRSEGAISSTATDNFWTGVDMSEQLNTLYPDNMPAPRFWNYYRTQYIDEATQDYYKELDYTDVVGGQSADSSAADIEYTEESMTTDAQYFDFDGGESHSPTQLLKGNDYNNLYYNVTDAPGEDSSNWEPPSLGGNADWNSKSEDIGAGMFMETFIKVGEEYWNPDNLRDFLRWIQTGVESYDELDNTAQINALSVMKAYADKKVYYGNRIVYVDGRKDAAITNLRELCVKAAGQQPSNTATPNMARLNGLFACMEGTIFEKEEIVNVDTSLGDDVGVYLENTDGTTSLLGAGTGQIQQTSVTHEQESDKFMSLPLAESMVEIGSLFEADAIITDTGETTALADIDLDTGTYQDLDRYEFFTPWGSQWELSDTAISSGLASASEDLRNEMVAGEDFKLLFDYCFPTSTITEVAWYYCAMMTAESATGIRQSFSATKDELRKLFIILYNDIGTGGDGFSYQAETEVDTVETATKVASTDGGGNIAVKMALMTIPLLIKGLAETFDPNIRIAKLIKTGVEAGGGNIAKFPATLAALPFNIIPPPPFGPGIGPPITPLGIAYLALGALTPAEKTEMRMSESTNSFDDNYGTDSAGGDAEQCNTNVDEEADA